MRIYLESLRGNEQVWRAGRILEIKLRKNEKGKNGCLIFLLYRLYVKYTRSEYKCQITTHLKASVKNCDPKFWSSSVEFEWGKESCCAGVRCFER